MKRGQSIYYCNACDSKDKVRREGIFLEEMSESDACGNKSSKILNDHDKIEVVRNSLIVKKGER